jgi:hypothetical protein
MNFLRIASHGCGANAKAHGLFGFICIGILHIKSIGVPNHPWVLILKCMKVGKLNKVDKVVCEVQPY